MYDRRTFAGLRSATRISRSPADKGLHGRPLAKDECLEQLLRAFHDIADRDDIHQAAQRLALVQQWIREEADRAAADPIFAELQPA